MKRSIKNNRHEIARHGRNRRGALQSMLHGLVLMGTALILIFPARGEILEPDNVLYGTIVLDDQVITAAQTDVIIEARRMADGPSIARYRMGSNSRFGSFYVLRLAVESLRPITRINASEPGDSVYIVVSDQTGTRGQTTYTLPERGHAQRVDFGTAVSDSDGDGLPDAWEIAHFGGIGPFPETLSPNGLTAMANFIAGSNPNNPQSLFHLTISTQGNHALVSFLARRAEGVGYEGRQRVYDLESTADPAAGPWVGLGGLTNVLGNNQVVTHSIPLTNTIRFHRGAIRLQ